LAAASRLETLGLEWAPAHLVEQISRYGSERDETMNLGRNPRIRLALFSTLVAIMTLTGLWNGSPVWAQEPSPAPPPPNTSFNLQYLLLQDSPGGSAVISDGSGTVLGTGDFHARVTYTRSGRTDGDVIIDFTTIFTDPLPVSLEVGFTALDELL
jgi:hypothetical protein